MKRKVMIALFAISAIALAWLLLPHGERNFIWDSESLFLHEDDEPFGSALFDEMAEKTMPNGYTYFQGSLDELLDSEERRSLLLICTDVLWDEDAAERIDSFVRSGNKLMLVCNESYGSDKCTWIRDINHKRYFSKGDLKEVLMGHQSPDTLYCTNGDRIPVPKPLLTSFYPYSIMAKYTSSVGPVLSYKRLKKKREKEANTVLYTFDGDTVAVPDPYETNDSLVMEYTDKEDFESAVSSAWESWNDSMGETTNEYISMTVDVGKGKVYLVASPLLFTNYGVLDSNISKFVGWQLSQIADRPVVRFPKTLVKRRLMNRDDVSYDSSSPLYYMLNHPPLRWAIYTLLVAIVLFMLFTARRRQRRIPVVDLPQNRNLSFVQLLGTIYYRRHDNADLLRKKYTYFREELRRSMLLDIGDAAENTVHKVRLAQKTGLDEAFIAKTLDMVSKLTADRVYVSDEQLQECIDRMNKIIKNI